MRKLLLFSFSAALLMVVLFPSCSREVENKSAVVVPDDNKDKSIENLDSVSMPDSLDTEKDSIAHKTDTIEYVNPQFLSFSFKSADNPDKLKEDIECKIVGDSIVECWLSGIQTNKKLIPSFTFNGDGVFIDSIEIKSGITKCNFKRPLTFKVVSGNKYRNYSIYVHAYTGIPIIWIRTEGSKEIISKSSYLKASFRLVEDVVTRFPGDIVEADVQIKGRGNTTWGHRMPKKSYRLKFFEKQSLLSEPKDKSWVLLANYIDNTMLRNQVASFLGLISNLDYTPKFHFVELILNGKYNGTYQLGDKIKISKHRVNVGDDGFLLEIDARANDGDISFKANHLKSAIVIKDPDVEKDDSNYVYVRDYVLKAEEALFSDHFKDPDTGWQKYMDIDSFVDWYLINEIAKNNDAHLYASCFMNLQRGGKLKMGPIWDFDLAFGNTSMNHTDEPEGLWVGKSTWYSRLLKDPVFKAKVRERFSYFYSKRDNIMREIDENASYLRYSVKENNDRWGRLSSSDPWKAYQKEVNALKDWITARLDWLNTEFQ